MKYKKNVYESFVLIMQFGINMLVPILLCTALGVYLSDKTGHPIIVVPLFFIGAIAGFQNIYRMAKRIFSQESSRDERKSFEEISGIKQVSDSGNKKQK